MLVGESANLLSVGAVDFGIIVDSSVITVENVFRNLQMPAAEQARLLASREARVLGMRVPERMRMIFVSALQVDKAVFFSAAITVAAFVPLFTMQGVEGQIFGPMARTYGYALLGALIATFTVTPVLCSYLPPKDIEEKETAGACAPPRLRADAEVVAVEQALRRGRRRLRAGADRRADVAPGDRVPAGAGGRQPVDPRDHAADGLAGGRVQPVARMRQIPLRHPEVATVVSQHGRPDDGSDAAGFFNAEFFVPLKPFDQWPAGMTKENWWRRCRRSSTMSSPASR